MKRKINRAIRKLLGLGLTKEELEKKRKAEHRELMIQSVMEKTGWDRETAHSEMKRAKNAVGISFKDYNKYNFYNIDEKAWVEEYKRIEQDILSLKEKHSSDKKEIISKIAKLNNWDEETTIEKIRDARKRTGCHYKEYYMYKFDELEPEVQEQMFLIRDSNQLADRYDTSSEIINILCDKEKTNQLFRNYMHRPWCVNTKVSMDEFKSIFSNCDRVIYKPLDGNRGFNVESYRFNEVDIEDVYRTVAKLPDGVVEAFVKQHPDMNKLTDASVNTIRIVTISSNKKTVTRDGKHFDIAYAALRIGGGKSIVDNFHSGGMTAAIDLESGILVTDGADMDRNVYTEHPVTGTPIKGFVIPMFKEALELVRSAWEETKIEGYLGWDIAIAEDGPMIIEVNLKPGVVLLNTPYVSEHVGKRSVMDKYLF